MTDYQRYVERRLAQDDQIARVAIGPCRTGYLYHRDGRYWYVESRKRRGEWTWNDERPAGTRRRGRLFDGHEVEVMSPDAVGGRPAELARGDSVGDDEDEEEQEVVADGGQRRLGDY